MSRKTLFARTSHFLEEYAQVCDDCMSQSGTSEGDRNYAKDRDEMRSLSKQLLDLNGEWERRQSFSSAENAAVIIASMLEDWKLSGSVWFMPGVNRFRLTGEGYRPTRGEICVGVYNPSVHISSLAEDFKTVLKEAAIAEAR